jgi:hypothetical protein
MKTHILITILLLGLSSTAKASSNDVINVTFNSDAIGKYSSQMLKKDFPSREWGDSDRGKIVSDIDEERGHVLQVTYPRDALGPREGGVQFLVNLQPTEELWLSYYVKFKKGFDFSKGGKLPGLTSGGSSYTGGNKPKNGEGWSARYMWRKHGAAEIYLYHVDMPGKWGDDLLLKELSFTPGKWYKLVQHIKINSNNKKNGIIEVWVDGKKMLSRNDLRLRLGDQGLIDSFYFSTFHGGNTRDWAPYVKSVAFFDDIVITKNAIITTK